MALPEQFIQEVKMNNPIDSVMSGYANLIRRGRNAVCLCPFHSEKTPSCTVYLENNSFYCFGCGTGGDVVTFIMKIENLDYIEALKFLADRAGMTFPNEENDVRAGIPKARILEMNRAAARYFHDILKNSADGEKGRRYFAERQLLPKTITKYGLGYAPDDWHSLANFMHSQGYKDDELVTANLCDKGRNGGVYDRFRDRVMFPIIDLRGNVIAFGGRIIDGSGPKYLNSSDTPAFKKSMNLFSMNFAKRSDERRLILAEGYMDVISINQAGFENVVASLGTSLTQEQARLMSRYADEVIIAYDSDGAGQNATHKAINLLSAVGLKTRIIKMEGAKDPDEYIKKFGAPRFRQLLDKSAGAMEFEIAKCRSGLDISTEAGKVEYLKRCVKLFSEVASPIEREIYISRIADETKVHKEMLMQQVNGAIKKQINAEQKQQWADIRTFRDTMRSNPEAYKHPKEYKAETGVLAFIAAYPEDAEYVISKLSPEHFVTSFNKKVYEAIIEKTKKSAFYDILSLQSEFTADEMGKITEIAVNGKNVNIDRTTVDDLINILTEHKDDQPGADKLSDDDFRDYFKKLQSRK